MTAVRTRRAADRLVAQVSQGRHHVAQADSLGVPGVDGYGVRHWRPSRSISWSAWRGPQVPAA